MLGKNDAADVGMRGRGDGETGVGADNTEEVLFVGLADP